MDYQIEISDTQNPEGPFIVQKAARDSISLRWLGGDDKTQPIVGSELAFTLEVNDGSDGKFDQYFTNDEQRYLVTKRVIESGEVIWRGYLLPESYTEPWENPLFYVELSAVDGLGLLKGKKIPDEFYSDEKTAIEILSAILKLTGLPMDIYLSPAIQNTLIQNWKDIFTDTRKFVKDRKRMSAYDVLEAFMISMRCVIYQCDERWYIEGINKRHLISVEWYRYDIEGDYKGVITIDKNVKDVPWTPGTMLIMVPAIKQVEVTHEARQLEIPHETIQENNIRWRSSPGVVSQLYPRHWIYSPDYQPIMKAPDYYLELPSPNEEFTGNPYEIRLKEKIYVLRNWRVKVTIDFELVSRANTSQIDERIDNFTWVNPNTYSILLNNKVVAYNLNDKEHPELTLKYNRDLRATGSYEFIATEDGLLDIALNPANGLIGDTQILGVKVTNITVEKLEQEIDFTHTRVIDENSSVEKEIDVFFSDDVSALSPSFYLEPLRQHDEETNFKMEVDIQSGFTLNGKHYSVVSLQGAHLIEQYIDGVQYYDADEKKWPYLEDLKVIYNLNGGEQMVVQTPFPITSGVFRVTVTFYEPAQIERTEWLKWTDAIYGVEKKRHAHVVADIESKLFSLPHLQLEGNAMSPIKFNDIIKFRYKGQDKFFFPTNLDWNPDANDSRGTFVEGIYAGDSFGNIPPYVEAGPDLYLENDATTVQVSEAVVAAPGGYIDTLEWSRIEGPSGEVFSDAGALNPQISGLTGDSYTFQLLATNNEGAQGLDTFRVIRKIQHELQNTVTEDRRGRGDGSDYQVRSWEISLDPDIPADDQLVLQFEAEVKVDGGRRSAYLDVIKNGRRVFQIGDPLNVGEETFRESGSVSMIQGDVVSVYTRSSWGNTINLLDGVHYNFTVTSATLLGENSDVSNIPFVTSYVHYIERP